MVVVVLINDRIACLAASNEFQVFVYSIRTCTGALEALEPGPDPPEVVVVPAEVEPEQRGEDALLLVHIHDLGVVHKCCTQNLNLDIDSSP